MTEKRKSKAANNVTLFLDKSTTTKTTTITTTKTTTATTTTN